MDSQPWDPVDDDVNHPSYFLLFLWFYLEPGVWSEPIVISIQMLIHMSVLQELFTFLGVHSRSKCCLLPLLSVRSLGQGFSPVIANMNLSRKEWERLCHSVLMYRSRLVSVVLAAAEDTVLTGDSHLQINGTWWIVSKQFQLHLWLLDFFGGKKYPLWKIILKVLGLNAHFFIWAHGLSVACGRSPALLFAHSLLIL